MSIINKYILDIETKGAKASKQAIGGVTNSLGSMAKKMGVVAGAYFGSQALISGIKASVQAFAQQELAEKKLEQALGRTSSALLNQASALQKTSTFGDEATIAQMSYLASIGLTEKQISEMIPVAMDLASATGMTLEGAVRNTAKTLSGMTGELGESVPKLRELTAEQLKAGEGVKVLGELFGGMAETESKSLSGSLTQMTNAIGDTAEALGGILSPAVIGIANLMTSFAESVTGIMNWRDEFLALANDASYLSDTAYELMLLEEQAKNMSKSEIIDMMESLGAEIGSVGESSIEMGKALDIASDAEIQNHEKLMILMEAYSSAGDMTDNMKEQFASWNLAKDEQLAKYEKEQEFIEMLIEKNPALAKTLGLVSDATKKQEQASRLKQRAEVDAMNASAGAIGQFVGGAKIAGRIQQVSATIDAYRTINKIMADPKLVFPTNVLTATSVGASAFANVMSISKSLGEFKTASEGFDGIVTKPTLFLTGEDGAERVNVSNLEKPDGGADAGGGGITLNISAPLVDESVVEHIIPAIERANRMSLA